MSSSIYGVHDDAKDKDFELEMSWVCDESNRQHEKVCLGVLSVTSIQAICFSLWQWQICLDCD